MKEPVKLRRERRTMETMVRLFCSGVHRRRAEECPTCSDFLAYAHKRVEKCPYQQDKPPCAKCPIHCYMPSRRTQVKAVMRYAGPRMALRHPWFALRHWLASFKKAPEGKRNRPER
jgi:hypothetical protein